MKEMYITVTGLRYYYGCAPFTVGKKVRCVKEPDNPYDSEAIKVTRKHVGTVGHVANSVYTTANGTMSAGRIYDKVGKAFRAEVMFVTQSSVICRVLPETAGDDADAGAAKAPAETPDQSDAASVDTGEAVE